MAAPSRWRRRATTRRRPITRRPTATSSVIEAGRFGAIRRRPPDELVESLQLAGIEKWRDLHAQRVHRNVHGPARAGDDGAILTIGRLEKRPQRGTLREITRLDD